MSRKGGATGASLVRLRGPAVAGIARLACRLGVALAALPLQTQAAPADASRATDQTQPKNVCAEMSSRAWPVGLTSRRARIAELQRLRSFCLDDSAFLAVLGALLLEDGDAEQALMWLERSVMLDPDSLGARVDLALALSAVGQPGALKELAEQLRHRSDMPAALRERLYPADRPSVFALPPVRLGHALRPEWGFQGEISLLTGHEGNLDRSPRLNELTLTLPDGPLTLPVESQPRSGLATIAAAALELAYSPQPALVLRSGFILGARSAPSRHSTDWRQWQWIANASYSFNGVRVYGDYGIAGVGGPLGEPYLLRRLAAGLESRLDDCRARISYEVEDRQQSVTTTLDSRADAWIGAMQCPTVVVNEWNWLLDLRVGRDKPESESRPGGMQRSEGAGLRLAGPVARRLQLEISWRSSRARDALGYSPLLENNAARRISLHQLTVELSAPVYRGTDQRIDAVLKWQGARQSSNLPLFQYRANSTYGGLRWIW